MLKITKKNIWPILAAAVLLVALFAISTNIAYKLGERHISELILHSDVPDGTNTYKPVDYTQTIENLQEERSRLSNDYTSACANYQTLYAAYDALYAQAGADSGQEKIVLPDSARGSGESCYR